MYTKVNPSCHVVTLISMMVVVVVDVSVLRSYDEYINNNIGRMILIMLMMEVLMIQVMWVGLVALNVVVLAGVIV